MATALIRRKTAQGLEFEQRAIVKMTKTTVYIKRGATGSKDIVKIDREAMKRYIEQEGYGES